MSSYTINIKRIRNKYDINLNMIIEITPFSIIYEGYKLNTIEQNVVIIESIQLKNQISFMNIQSKNSHPFIIKPIEVIQDNLNIYIVYPNYSFFNKINIKTKTEFDMFFNEFRILIKHIIDSNLNIEPIKLKDIYMKDTIHVLLHYTQNNKMEQYGSPIYSPPELFSNKKILLEEKLLWNFGIILYEIIKKTTPYESCKDIKDIINLSKIINFNNNDEDNFLKLFLANNYYERVNIKDFYEIKIEEYNFFKNIEINETNEIEINNKEEINEEQKENSDDIFDLEI